MVIQGKNTQMISRQGSHWLIRSQNIVIYLQSALLRFVSILFDATSTYSTVYKPVH